MLDRLKKSAGSLVAKLFIGLLVLSFAVWGIADIFSFRGEDTVAWVSDTPVTLNEFRIAFNGELRAASDRQGSPVTVDDARSQGIDQRVLDILINQAALTDQARRMGLRISDEEVAKRILDAPGFQSALGQFDRVTFDLVLRSNGLTEADYVERERSQAVREQLLDMLQASFTAPLPLATVMYDHRNEKRTARYINIPESALEAAEEPDEEELQSLLERQERRFSVPETRDLKILILDPETLVESMEVSEDEVATAWEDRREEFDRPETRQVDQLPFPDREEAEAAYARLSEEMAPESSEESSEETEESAEAEEAEEGNEEEAEEDAPLTFDTLIEERGLTAEDVDLGDVTRDDMLNEDLADAAFALEAGAFSAPVEGPLGTVLLRVREITPAYESTLEADREAIREALALERSEAEAFDLHNVVEDRRAAGGTLKEITDALDLPLLEINGITAQGNDLDDAPIEAMPEIGDLLSLAFETEAGTELDPQDTGNGGLYWLEVEAVNESELKPLDDVRDELVELWKEEKTRDGLDDLARDLVDRAREGESLETLAAEHDLSVEDSEPLERNGSADPLSGGAVARIFETAQGDFDWARSQEGDSVLVMEVLTILPPERTDGEADADIESLRGELQGTLDADLLEELLAGLRDELGVSVNPQGLQYLFDGPPVQRSLY